MKTASTTQESTEEARRLKTAKSFNLSYLVLNLMFPPIFSGYDNPPNSSANCHGK